MQKDCKCNNCVNDRILYEKLMNQREVFDYYKNEARIATEDFSKKLNDNLTSIVYSIFDYMEYFNEIILKTNNKYSKKDI